MSEIDGFDVVRRRKLTPPPPIKPKPKLTLSMCQQDDIDVGFHLQSVNGAASLTTPSEVDDDQRPSSSTSTVVELPICQQNDNNDDSNRVLPKGTVKALAEKFGGSTKNLFCQNVSPRMVMSQTLPRPPRPPSRKVSFKHRVLSTAQISNDKFATIGHIEPKKRNTAVGILAYGSRNSLRSSGGSLNSLNSGSLKKDKRARIKKSLSQDMLIPISNLRTRCKSVDVNLNASEHCSSSIGSSCARAAEPQTILAEEKNYICTRGPPPPVPAKPRGFSLYGDSASHCNQIPLPTNPNVDQNFYNEYETISPLDEFVTESNREMTMLDHSKLELSGRIYHTVHNGGVFENYCLEDEPDILETSFDTGASYGSDTVKEADSENGDDEKTETNVNMVNSCENYAEIIYEVPSAASQQSSGNESGKKSISSWDTNSSLASSSETSAVGSLTGFRSHSQELRSSKKTGVGSKCRRQTLDDGAISVADHADPLSSEEAVGTRRGSQFRLPRSLRPKSQSIDMDRLWRIKSDIRLNLTQAMGKIRLRVSTNRGSRDKKAKSTFYLPNATSDPASISITLEAPLSSDSATKDDDASSSVSGETWDMGDNEEDDDSVPIAIAASFSAPTNYNKQLPDLVQHEVLQNLPSNSNDPTPCSPCSDTRSNAAFVTPSTVDALDNTITDLERFEMIYSSRFAFSEPLYQHYRSETTGVQRNQTFSEADARGARREKLLNASQLGSQRTLWCELPEVQEAGLLSTLKADERKLQEAMFEVVTSEASYLRSLNILITHFMACPKLSSNSAMGSVITRQERKRLFSNILAVRDCTENLLCNLETRLERNVILDDVCDVLIDHLYRNCEIYVKYCGNQIYQERTLNMLKTTNAEFRSVLTELESSGVCESLDLRSFLMLPMQRITRYPLLAGAILHRISDKTAPIFQTAEKAFAMSSKVVKECNESAKRLERIEQMIELEKHFIYKEGGPKRMALISGNRWLIKQGAVVQIEMRRRSLGRPQTRKLYLFLFTDYLFVTKTNGENNEKTYCVRDYCPRQFLNAEPLEPNCPQVPVGIQIGNGSYLLLLTLMKNHRNKQSDFVLTVNTETERTRWLDSIRPKCLNDMDDEEEKVYEIWDCPQIKCIQIYEAKQEDELDLELDELVNVLRKLPDGWYHGERLRDGRTGWFPSSCTIEVISDHIRAKNYRQRLKLMHEAELQMQSNMNNTLSKRSSGLSMAKSIFRV